MRIARLLALLLLGAVMSAAPDAVGGVPCAHDTLNIAPAFSPDGTRVVFVNSPHGGCTPFGTLMSASSSGGEPQPVLTPGREAADPAFSPDGTRVAFASCPTGLCSTPTITVRNLDGSREVPLAQGRSPSWSPDGSRLVYTELDSTIAVVEADGGSPRRLVAGTNPEWSPAGDQIAFKDDRGAVFVIAPDGGEARQLHEFGDEPFIWSRDGRRLAFGEWRGLVVADTAGGKQQRFAPWTAAPLAWDLEGTRLALQSGEVLDLTSGLLDRRFGYVDLRAVTPDWRRYVVALASGPFAYEGNDLYLRDVAAPNARLVSPRRCSQPTTRCREGTDLRDSLRAGEGAAHLRGLAGHDSLFGSATFNRIEAAFGDDAVHGRRGNDHLFGGPGRDRMWGEAGNDLIDGGPGNDVLASGTGRGRIFGGPGDDRIDARAGRGTTVRCGEGVDSVRANRTTHVAQDCERVRRERIRKLG